TVRSTPTLSVPGSAREPTSARPLPGVPPPPCSGTPPAAAAPPQPTLPRFPRPRLGSRASVQPAALSRSAEATPQPLPTPPLQTASFPPRTGQHEITNKV